MLHNGSAGSYTSSGGCADAAKAAGYAGEPPHWQAGDVVSFEDPMRASSAGVAFLD